MWHLAPASLIILEEVCFSCENSLLWELSERKTETVREGLGFEALLQSPVSMTSAQEELPVWKWGGVGSWMLVLQSECLVLSVSVDSSVLALFASIRFIYFSCYKFASKNIKVIHGLILKQLNCFQCKSSVIMASHLAPYGIIPLKWAVLYLPIKTYEIACVTYSIEMPLWCIHTAQSHVFMSYRSGGWSSVWMVKQLGSLDKTFIFRENTKASIKPQWQHGGRQWEHAGQDINSAHDRKSGLGACSSALVCRVCTNVQVYILKGVRCPFDFDLCAWLNYCSLNTCING